MIQLESIAKRYGGDELFSSLNWQIPDGESIGFVGPNGAGKTTLFRIIADMESADDGQVIKPQKARIGYLPQEMSVESDGTVLDIVLQGRQDLLDLEMELEELEQRMAAESDDEQLATRYAEAQDRFRREGGYQMRSTAREIASGMGFDVGELDDSIHLFSGGWQMRALLARLLYSRPDLLLLDEPTNHLDVESIEWLEQFLANYKGTVVTISHDRYFLNRLVDMIAEIHDGSISVYHGNYDYYLEERERRRQRLIEKREQQQKEIAEIQEFIDKFRYNASKASQVQSRIKKIEKMDRIDVPPSYNSDIHFQFPEPPRIGKVVIEARDLAKRYGDHVIYDGVDLKLMRGDRLAFVGPNGAGKSTLMEMIGGRLEPDEGTVELGHRVDINYYAQHSVDQLDVNRTVLEEMHEAATYESAPDVRSILGAFLFQGDDVHKSISVLSGGEKSRLALAKMLLEPAGCLLLDEPTNHLDIPSRQILEHALQDFDGAFCVISHDRYFLSEVVNRVIHIDDGQLQDYRGGYEEYRRQRQKDLEGSAFADSEVETSKGKGSPSLSPREIRRQTAQLREEKRRETSSLRSEVDALEERIESLEAELDEVEQTLADPELHQGDNGERIQRLQKRHGELESQLMVAMEKWEEKGGQLQDIEDEYKRRESEIRSS